MLLSNRLCLLKLVHRGVYSVWIYDFKNYELKLNCGSRTLQLATRMAVYGQIGPFDHSVEEWTQYAERLDLFMDANGIRSEAKKRPPYKLLRNLLAPQ